MGTEKVEGGSGDQCVSIVVEKGNSSSGKEKAVSGSTISGIEKNETEAEIVGIQEKSSRESSVSECSVVVDLEAGVQETNVVLHLLSRTERDCRICHLSLDAANQESSGVPIELGCSCKNDLAAAHRHCAESWFKIKGNKTCEICGSIAHNVVGPNEAELLDDSDEGNEASSRATVPAAAAEPRNFWQGHRFLNFLLACMVFAFVISWLFHFNIPS